MSGWLYLIRNRDLHKIGITKNFDNRMRQLKPDNVIAKLYSRDFVKLEKELHNRYKKYRIPQTEYFRLKDSHLKEIKQRIYKLNCPISLILLIFLKALFYINIIFFLILLLLSLYINDINTLFIKALVCMERISFGLSFLSIFLRSAKYLSIIGELKYRLSRLIIYIMFALLFHIAYLLIQ